MRNRKAGTILLAVSLAVLRGVAGPGLSSSGGAVFPGIADKFGVGMFAVTLFVSVAAAASAVTMPVWGRILKALPPRVPAAVAVVLTCGGFSCIGIVPDLRLFVLAAAVFGCGSGLLATLLAPAVIGKERGSGKILGFITAGAALIGVIVGPVLSLLVRAVGTSVAPLIVGGGCALISLPCLVFLPGKAKKQEEKKKKADTPLPLFPLIALFLFLFLLTGFSSFHQQFAALGEARAYPAFAVPLAFGISCAGIFLGAVAVGWLGEKWDPVPVGGIVLFLGLPVSLLFLTPPVACYLIASFFHGVSASAIGVTVPAVLARRYPDYSEKTLSRLMVAYPIGTVLLAPSFGLAFDRLGSYTLPLILSSVLLPAAALLLLFAFRKKGEKKTEKPLAKRITM